MDFLESWKIGCYCPDFIFFFMLAMAGAEVGENYTRRRNRSLLSKALQMHLSELNTYELCRGLGDDSTVTGADREGGGGKRKRQRATHTGVDAPNVFTHRDAYTQALAQAKKNL